MKNKLTIMAILAISASSLLTACQATVTTGNNSAANKPAENTNTAKPAENTNTTNANAAKTDANNSAPNDAAKISAKTPTEAYKAAYAARKNKDIAALKQLISKEMFEFFEIMGEGAANPVDEGLKQMCEQPQGATDEVRNEKINGDKATLQFLDKDGKWTTLDLVKEDGIWKLTIDKMEDDKKSK